MTSKTHMHTNAHTIWSKLRPTKRFTTLRTLTTLRTQSTRRVLGLERHSFLIIKCSSRYTIIIHFQECGTAGLAPSLLFLTHGLCADGMFLVWAVHRRQNWQRERNAGKTGHHTLTFCNTIVQRLEEGSQMPQSSAFCQLGLGVLYVCTRFCPLHRSENTLVRGGVGTRSSSL